MATPRFQVSCRLGNGKWQLRDIPKARSIAWGRVNWPSCSGRRQYAVNTEAIVRGSYPPMDWITVPREEWQGAISNVRQLWVDAGEALRYEQIERAQELIREAKWLSCEGF